MATVDDDIVLIQGDAKALTAHLDQLAKDRAAEQQPAPPPPPPPLPSIGTESWASSPDSLTIVSGDKIWMQRAK